MKNYNQNLIVNEYVIYLNNKSNFLVYLLF